MSAFAKRYPEVEIQLDLTDWPVYLIEQGYDFGVRFGELPDTRLSARRILANRRYLCASPFYLAQHGSPQTLADLTRHRCIIHGLLIRSEWDLAKYLASGRPQVVLPAYRLPDADLFVFYPSRSNLSARVRTFIDFLVEQIGPAKAP